MARQALLAFALIASLGLGACSTSTPTEPDPVATPAPSPAASPAPSAAVSAIVDLTNAERTRVGLAPLRAEGRLMQAAELQATQVAELGRLEHTIAGARYPTLQDRVDSVGYRWQTIGENLASGQRDPAAAVQAWMQSEGHRSNILNGNFTEIGAAVVADRNARPYYVQVFARPR